MAVVYVKKTCAAGGVMLRGGQAWDADADVVKAHPDLFADEPEKVHGRPRGGVERATRAPGETRRARAPKKPAGEG